MTRWAEEAGEWLERVGKEGKVALLLGKDVKRVSDRVLEVGQLVIYWLWTKKEGIVVWWVYWFDLGSPPLPSLVFPPSFWAAGNTPTNKMSRSLIFFHSA